MQATKTKPARPTTNTNKPKPKDMRKGRGKAKSENRSYDLLEAQARVLQNPLDRAEYQHLAYCLRVVGGRVAADKWTNFEPRAETHLGIKWTICAKGYDLSDKPRWAEFFSGIVRGDSLDGLYPDDISLVQAAEIREGERISLVVVRLGSYDICKIYAPPASNHEARRWWGQLLGFGSCEAA